MNDSQSKLLPRFTRFTEQTTVPPNIAVYRMLLSSKYVLSLQQTTCSSCSPLTPVCPPFSISPFPVYDKDLRAAAVSF